MPTAGRYTQNTLPEPGVLATLTVPFDCFTMPYTVERPRPVPRPGSFVVKNGSKICVTVAASMPWPVSRTRMSA